MLLDIGDTNHRGCKHGLLKRIEKVQLKHGGVGIGFFFSHEYHPLTPSLLIALAFPLSKRQTLGSGIAIRRLFDYMLQVDDFLPLKEFTQR